MANTIQIGSEEFKVDLAQLAAAIGTVSSNRDAIENDLKQLESELAALASSWQSPAGATFDDFQATLISAAGKMSSVLDQMVSRMRTTHDTYLNAEQANTKNLS